MLDPRPQLANNHVDQFDPSRCTNDNYGTWGPWNFGPRTSKTAQNYEDYRNNSWGIDDDGDEGVQFRPLYEQDDRYSGVHSTPPSHVSYYRSLSPGSRTQAIASGQRELMEMVKNMPESSYELSLKDLVEQPKVENSQEELLLPEKITCEDDDQLPKVVANQRVSNMKRQESKKNIEKKLNMITRSTSIENGGLFLKMVFPISLKSKKTKKLNNSTCSKVSPKPEVSERTSKSVDKDWWKKRFSASSEGSDSSGRRSSSNNNNNSNGSSGSSGSSNSCRSSIRKNNGFFSSCLPCFHFTKGETAE